MKVCERKALNEKILTKVVDFKTDPERQIKVGNTNYFYSNQINSRVIGL